MNDKEFDRLLGVKTAGMREWLTQSSHYNRYEATPYRALEALFQEYPLEREDEVVDFGSGKGRLAFYIADRFQAKVIGIEMNGQLYHEALDNKAKFEAKRSRHAGFIQFERCQAEEYAIEPSQNKFYFFNPFSIQIFMTVVRRILQATRNREVDLILYYPTDDYVEFLETRTPFWRVNEVPVPGLYEEDSNERFLIFRHTPFE
ncbi:methyltransferase [Sporosarcina sp. 179-K 3D1 HS]|uniref:methyltransferase n=1 Tax=Sporosarcina sp. 179-K 3D1 HS TaxID=3232169 RepID=UPI0039A366B7